MFPVLFNLGDFSVPTYGVIYLIAFLSGAVVCAYFGQTDTIPFKRMFEIGFQATIAGELGARLTFVIVEWDRFAAGAIGMRQFLVSGRVVLGGIVAGAAFFAYIVWKHKLPILRLMDAGITGAALGMAIGRIGCLAAGCCFGKPTDWWWGITFTHPLAEKLNGTPLGIALLPTQILQFLSAMVLFALLVWMHRWKSWDGQILVTFFLGAGLMRFGSEFLRGDPRGGAVGITTSQWIALGMVLVAGACLVYRSVRGRRMPCG